MPHQLIDTRAGMPESSSQVENVPQVVRAVRAEVGAVGVGAGDGAVVDPAEAVTGQDCASAGGGAVAATGAPTGDRFAYYQTAKNGSFPDR